MRPLLRISFFLSFLIGMQLHAQPIRLSIVSITGLPGTVFADTAHPNVSYDSVYIAVQNSGNSIFNGYIDILYESSPGLIGTMYLDTGQGRTLGANATDTLHPLHFFFSSVYFDGGDNIVVVWPSARFSSVPSDSITINVLVDPSIGIAEIEDMGVKIAPNPVTQYLRMQIPEGKRVKQVRIFDSTSRLLFTGDGTDRLDFSDYDRGIYLVQLLFDNDRTARIRVVKN